MFPSLDEIRASNVDDSCKTLGRIDDEVVVFKHLELTQFLALGRFVQDTFIDSLRLVTNPRKSKGRYVWNRIIDEL